ncbi:MAG: hypothetical protein GVY17_14045 [Cyanobacteria bacterium]|nr:hypothetical protein [Cyanobacteria bacterium GSL.Bin21]
MRTQHNPHNNQADGIGKFYFFQRDRGKRCNEQQNQDIDLSLEKQMMGHPLSYLEFS